MLEAALPHYLIFPVFVFFCLLQLGAAFISAGLNSVVLHL